MKDAKTTPKPGPREPGPAPTSLDPIDIALAAEAEGVAPEGVARRVLLKQEVLIGWQIASERAGVALKVLTGLAGLAVAGALAVLAWQASQADGVLLEPFTVPPALAADGVSGQVVAAQVLDELSRLRSETVETGRARDYANDWGRDISVAIPATGVSLGDLQAALRLWLGHETRITGEVYRTPAGIAMRARVRGGVAIQAEGPADDIQGLARSIAQGVYRETQPVRYARYMGDHGDLQAAIILAQTAALTARDQRGRAEAYAEWGNALNNVGKVREAIPLDLKARRLAPDWWLPAFQLANHEFNLGHSEAALGHMREAARLRLKDPSLPKAERGAAFYLGRVGAMAQEADRMRHWTLAAEDPATVAAEGSTLDRSFVSSLANLHDMAGSAARLRRPQFLRPWRGKFETDQLERGQANLFEVTEDWKGVRRLKEAIYAAYGNRLGLEDQAQLGFSRIMTGDVENGLGVLNSLPADCDPCMLYRARALAGRGDWAAGERLAATVEARTPSIPTASLVRGRILLDAGKAEAALVSLREAERRQPKWADPYKYEGDALARLGRWKEAEAAYARAYPLAPKWGGLHLKWGEAFAKLGKADEARAKWRTAAGLYLTPAEQTALAEIRQ